MAGLGEWENIVNSDQALAITELDNILHYRTHSGKFYAKHCFELECPLKALHIVLLYIVVEQEQEHIDR